MSRADNTQPCHCGRPAFRLGLCRIHHNERRRSLPPRQRKSRAKPPTPPSVPLWRPQTLDKAPTLTWRDQAACRPFPVTYWFAEPKTPEHAFALTTCQTCAVTQQCALEAESDGVWAGVDRTVKRKPDRPDRRRIRVRYTEPPTIVIMAA